MPDAGIGSARLDLHRAVAELAGPGAARTSVRVLADRNVVLIDSPHDVSLEAIPSKELPAAELGETGGAKWLHMKMPGDVDWPGMEFALAVAANGTRKAVAVVTSYDTKEKENVREAAIHLAQETVGTDPATVIGRHEQEWTRYWSASGVELDDPDLQLWWYRMVYYLRVLCQTGRGASGPVRRLGQRHHPLARRLPKPFAIIVENGVAKHVFVEAPGEFKVSSAEYVLSQL